LKKILQEIKPDLVHSFVLQISCLPILDVMRKNNQIPWVYSSWGSDLFNKSNKPDYDIDLKSVLSKVNFLFTDNLRDYNIALNNGFKGTFLGAFPGGGGFKYKQLDSSYFIPLEERKTILVKGYQGALGRSVEVLKAFWLLKDKLQDYNIIVFGADKEVVKFLHKNNYASKLSLQVFPKEDFLPHKTILKLMGESLIYIGNSISDGMPNTLLEAIIMGAFPIQSNPGGVTEEVVEHKKNGLLIYDCYDIENLKELIKTALTDLELIKSAFHINQNSIKPIFDYGVIQKQVLQAYQQIN
jgi:glycosyltransferase involved in cell wall biosynthesis